MATTLLLSLIGWFQLSFVDNLEAAFRSDAPAYKTYADLKQQFALGENDIFILIESEKPIDGNLLNAVAEFSLDAQLIDQVTGVASILSLRDYDPQSDRYHPVVDLVAPAMAAPDTALQAAVEHRLNLDGALLSTDLRRMSLRVLLSEPADNTPDLDQYQNLIEELQTVYGQAIGDLPVDSHWSGIPLLRLSVIEQLIRDQSVLNTLGGLLGIIGCVLMLGSWRLAVITSIAPTVAVFWLMGLMGHLSLSFNVITNVLPVLVLVIGFADAMHLSFSWRRLATDPENRPSAITTNMMVVGPACILTSATTAVAFLSLLISDSDLIRGFSIAGVLAVAVTLSAVLLIHPLALTLAIRFRFIDEREFRPRRISQVLDGIISATTGFVFRHCRTIAGGGLVLSLVAFALFTQVEPRYSFLENVPQDSVVARTIQKIDSTLGGTQSLDVIVPFESTDEERLNQSIEQLQSVHETLEALVAPHPVVSAWTIIRAMEQPLPSNLSARLKDLLTSLQPSLIGRDGDQALLQIMLPDNGAPYTRTLAGRVEQTLTGLHQPHFLSGILLVSAEISADVIRQLNWSIFATGVFSAFLLAIAFRRVSYVAFALLPNILPIILVGALLFVTGQGLQFSGALAMTIALGIAVDDTIHLLSRMKLHERDGALGVPILAALSDVGPVLISTSVVMVLGIAVTGFSQMPTIANFGFLSGLVIVLALVADLAILPAIIFSFKRSKSFRKDRPGT